MKNPELERDDIESVTDHGDGWVTIRTKGGGTIHTTKTVQRHYCRRSVVEQIIRFLRHPEL